MKTPIFVITCDRLNVLKKSLDSYFQNIKTPFEIVIHDNGSTYEPTIQFLQQLEKDGIKVYWCERINRSFELNNIEKTVNNFFENKTKVEYVVTDCDVALNNSCGDILNVFSFLLNKHPKVDVVGPVLEVIDVPDYYPRKTEVLNREVNNFWVKPVIKLNYKGKIIKYRIHRIDTTFGMYRAGFRFKRGLVGIRVHHPYSARHLDWYLNPDKLEADQEYYKSHCSKRISHWGWFDSE
jgi:glycosyltransferase involved in cell wall biosynthesis